MENNNKPRRKSGGAVIHYPKSKWTAVRASYFEDGIWSPTELARMHGVTLRSLEARMLREKWKAKVGDKYQREDQQRESVVRDDIKDLNELMVSRRESSNRQLIESTTALLDKVHKRIKVLNPNDGSEIAEMIGALKNLQGMLAGLLGGTKAGDKGPQIQVNILAKIIEEGDKANALEDGKSRGSGEMSRESKVIILPEASPVDKLAV